MTIPAIPMQLLVDDSDQTTAQMHILGNISRGHWLFGKDDTDTDASDISQALADLPKTVNEIVVHINSYGGEVAEGVAIYNALKRHPAKVTTVCEAFACSIASVIFMAGDNRVMRPASILMLHNASMGAKGDANAHRKAADILDTVTQLSKTAYLEHAKGELTAEKLTEIMDAETWITPEQALDWGLATEIDTPKEASDDDPSQSADMLILQSLANSPVRPVVARVELTQEQLDTLTARLDEKLEAINAALAAHAATSLAPCVVQNVDVFSPSETEVETNAQRLARVLSKLSEM